MVSNHDYHMGFDSRKPSLTRSQTDSNITYTGVEVPEAGGAANYVTPDGDIDYQVVLKAVHSVALRDNTCCTARVCEYVLNMLELLMDMGVMKQCLREESFGSKSGTTFKMLKYDHLNPLGQKFPNELGDMANLDTYIYKRGYEIYQIMELLQENLKTKRTST